MENKRVPISLVSRCGNNSTLINYILSVYIFDYQLGVINFINYFEKAEKM